MISKTINIISDRLQDFADAYAMVSFRIEYDKTRERVLVSYSVPDNIMDDDVFWDELLDLKRHLSADCQECPVLFCENERLFHLSQNAVEIQSHCPIQETCDSEYSFDFSSDTFPDYEFTLEEASEDFFGEPMEYSLAA